MIEIDRSSGLDIAPLTSSARFHISAPHPDYIIHLASSVSTPGSITDPVGTFRDTVCTAVNVMEAAREAKIPVLLTSSVKARDGRTPYGAAKRMVETWALEYAQAYDIPLVINRPGTIYGRGQEGSPESGWISWFLKAKREGLTVTVNGDGAQERDLLHVDDYIELMLTQIWDRVLGRTPWEGQIWDVGGGEQNTISVAGMVSWLGLDYKFGPERYGDALRYVGINDYKGWEPHIRWDTSDVFNEVER